MTVLIILGLPDQSIALLFCPAHSAGKGWLFSSPKQIGSPITLIIDRAIWFALERIWTVAKVRFMSGQESHFKAKGRPFPVLPHG